MVDETNILEWQGLIVPVSQTIQFLLEDEFKSIKLGEDLSSSFARSLD